MSPATIGIQNPSSTIKDWNTVPGICGVESRIRDCLRFPREESVDLNVGSYGEATFVIVRHALYYPSSI